MTTRASADVSVAAGDRESAVRHAVVLNRITLAYNAVEAVVALVAGLAARSISLVGFGLDSVVEVSAALALTWRLRQERRGDCTQDADRHATRAIAVSFAALAGYVGADAVRRLVAGEQPESSVPGVVLAAVSLAVMPLLARRKRRLAPLLGSRAQAAEADQTSLCALMSGVVLVGLLLNAVAGWWWADPVAAIALAGLAGRAAVSTWRADSLADTCCG